MAKKPKKKSKKKVSKSTSKTSPHIKAIREELNKLRKAVRKL